MRSPVHKCPYCGRFADMDSGFYARPPNSPASRAEYLESLAAGD